MDLLRGAPPGEFAPDRTNGRHVGKQASRVRALESTPERAGSPHPLLYGLIDQEETKTATFRAKRLICQAIMQSMAMATRRSTRCHNSKETPLGPSTGTRGRSRGQRTGHSQLTQLAH